MSDFFKKIDDADEIRQGDVIRKTDARTGSVIALGVVITADCDIAQEKAGGRYNWVEILPMRTYIEGPWATEQLRRLAKKRSKQVLDHLAGHIRRNLPGISPITHESLIEWLRTKSPEEVIESVSGAIPGPGDKQLRDLKIFNLATATNGAQGAFERLRSAWDLAGTSQEDQRNQIGNALKDGGGFQDYFVLPELPNMDGVGFVAVLRSMGTIMSHELFLTERDARIAGQSSEFHRLGRLSDGVRFSITQKLAFLFSRIGMPTTYESACEAACELVIDECFNNKVAV
ncbi:hypothetical protein ACLB90_19590 [Stenotrophomonas sp. LGBM10]|uniref:hypothetical protein n=1 Tax=Stenotrophomonas sp. LGBM10 TaxID=3390038 RepID=UPI00398B4024